MSTPCSSLEWTVLLSSLDFCLFLSQKHSSPARLGPQVRTELQAVSPCVHLALAGASHSHSMCENRLFLPSSSWMRCQLGRRGCHILQRSGLRLSRAVSLPPFPSHPSSPLVHRTLGSWEGCGGSSSGHDHGPRGTGRAGAFSDP